MAIRFTDGSKDGPFGTAHESEVGAILAVRFFKGTRSVRIRQWRPKRTHRVPFSDPLVCR